ncbi:MAG: hypothetical protein K6G79_08230 [Bacteroidales bacterium]|nr:hypothetical protein [Bacteroidales bacterium]
MAYQETTRQSYGSKVKGSFQGIIWGIILIIAGTIVLWWNEGRAVKASDALKDFQKNYVELTDINTVNPEFEGKAVHATGVAATDEILRDSDFGIAVNAFCLERNVEYYQWVQHESSESKDKLGGATETTTTYTYEPAWCSDPVDSYKFKDPEYQGKNSVWRVIEEKEQLAQNASFGAYRLTPSIISAISGEEPATPALTEAQVKQMLAGVADSTVVVTVTGDKVYIGADPSNPHIGDVRITFTQVTSPKTISLLQKVVNGTFESYVAKNGRQFSKVSMGTVSAENMIENQKAANKAILWLFRILGIILVVAGNKGLLGFLSTVFAVVPFVQKVIGAGVGFVATVIGIIWSLLVIAVAWVAHRPVLAIALLAIAVALVVWLVTRSRKKKLNNVAALLILCLALGIGASCTNDAKAGDNPQQVVSVSSDLKGPVKTVKVTELYGEGEPYTVTYEYDEKGNLVSQEEEEFYEGDEDYDIIEGLSEKNDAGQYTKMVYGSDGVPDVIMDYTYNERGDVTSIESRRADGTLNYIQKYRYDENGHQTLYTNKSPYGETAYTYEYDDQGRQVKQTFVNDGAVYSTTEISYDGENRSWYRKETYPQQNRVNEYYTTWDPEGNENGHRVYVTDSEGYRLNSSDSLFTDSKGFQNEIQYSNYDGNPKKMHGVFNKEHFLTHYEYFEGNASNPSIIMDCTYEKDGSTLRELAWKELSLGKVRNTRNYPCTPRYDTFGNWTRCTKGIPYLFDAEYTNFDNLENSISETYRVITYRGDDQGQNYGFEGRAGNADLKLTYTVDDDVLCGTIEIDGNSWKAVGRIEKDDSMYVAALMEDGRIPWSLVIPAGKGKREATLYYLEDMDPEETAVTLTPTRNGLKTYQFATKSDEIVALYEYSIPAYFTTGQIDASRCGDEWEDLHLEIENIWNKEMGPVIASDETTEFLGERTSFEIYKWNDETETNLVYTISFYDTFAIISVKKGNTNEFFPIGTTIAGIYAKIPAVG